MFIVTRHSDSKNIRKCSNLYCISEFKINYFIANTEKDFLNAPVISKFNPCIQFSILDNKEYEGFIKNV